MAVMKSKSLFQETITTLILCGLVLFAIGLFISEQFADEQVVQMVLAGSTVIGGILLALSLRRIRNRMVVADLLDRQLTAAGTKADQIAGGGLLSPIMTKTLSGTGWNALVKVVEDKTADQAIERRLQTSGGTRKTEKFARAIRSLAEGVAITDAKGSIQYINPAWASMLGQEAEQEEQIIGRQVIDCLALIGDTTEAIAALQGTRPINLSLQRGAETEDGVVQVGRLPLSGRAGESEGFVWTLKDVTQHVLTQEAHEQFLSSATHELRTPLTNIKAYTESLMEIDGISPEQQKEFFNVIYSEAGRLGRLLNQLLDIQQLEAGSMTIQVAAFDVLRMVKEVQDHIAPLLSGKDLKLTCKIAPNLKTISADKEKLTSCLVNLLGNAIKYTPAGGEVKLVAEQLESAVQLIVEDTGIGIAEEELPKVFERFYRCSDERVNELEGNGLGLAFCMEVAKLHGGDILVESKLNEGSRFTLRLPIASQSNSDS